MSKDKYYETATITLEVQYKIKWHRGSEKGRQDAIEAAMELAYEISGCGINGCYGCKRGKVAMKGGE